MSKNYANIVSNQHLSSDFIKRCDTPGFINRTDETGKTVLMHAIENGNIVFVGKLLEQNPDVNLQDNNGKTAFMYAAEKNDSTINKMLIYHNGINVNQVDKDSKTALMYAAENGAEEIVRKLIESVDNVNQVDKNDTKSLGIIKSQAPEVNKEAVNSLEAENKPRTTETAINDSTEVSGADFSLADKSGNTVLTHAEESGKEAAVRTPIEGANVNQVDNDGKTADYIEVVNSSEEKTEDKTITKVSGADFSLADKSGNTVLTHAEESGKEATVRTPIEGANVNQVDNDGKTASSDTHLGQDGCLPARTPMITTALRLMNAVRNIFTR